MHLFSNPYGTYKVKFSPTFTLLGNDVWQKNLNPKRLGNNSVAVADPGSGAFLTPEFGMCKKNKDTDQG